MVTKKRALPAVEPYLDGVAKSLLERLYGPKGLPWGTPLEELVDTIDAVRKALSEKLLAQALERQAHTAARPEPFTHCSGCGGPVQDQPQPEPRDVQTRVGEAHWEEPRCYCRTCRQAFFPSEPEPGA